MRDPDVCPGFRRGEEGQHLGGSEKGQETMEGGVGLFFVQDASERGLVEGAGGGGAGGEHGLFVPAEEACGGLGEE